ncbi:hypothetical protein NY547_11760 [Cnuibacter physcomitrellae]|uniref:hypothetical protein n=1 Tax=Cnuibacter physcomitrellae TaxID=1619308 RepID=UPI002175EE7D|nr:hypothetical protein [Cnuibacter physcomitrellae]MCS5497914.1 hypothetical protein [Cnuibacter physcomitrellae]
MTHPGGSDRSDLSSWWVDLLAGELGDCASVDRAGGPAEGIVVVTRRPPEYATLPRGAFILPVVVRP